MLLQKTSLCYIAIDDDEIERGYVFTIAVEKEVEMDDIAELLSLRDNDIDVLEAHWYVLPLIFIISVPDERYILWFPLSMCV